VACGIRTRNPRNRAAADPHLRSRGHWDRLGAGLVVLNQPGIVKTVVSSLSANTVHLHYAMYIFFVKMFYL